MRVECAYDIGHAISSTTREASCDETACEVIVGPDALERTRDLDRLTISQPKALLLGTDVADWVAAHGGALPSEAIAAVVKVMTAGELSRVACAIVHPLPGAAVAVGSPRHFGSRIQPNRGKDRAGQSRWRSALDHSCTTAICGIHTHGTPPEEAVHRIARTVRRILDERRSGVALHTD